MDVKVNHSNDPTWIEIAVSTKLPANLNALNVFSKNLYSVWNEDVKGLFGEIDPKIWRESQHNALTMIDKVDEKRYEQLSEDKNFVAKLNKIEKEFNEYVNAAPDTSRPSVAYFSMEYGLTEHLKIYSGGLGILAGDYLKEASDSNVNMVAVGLLYSYGYFAQSLSVDGQQIASCEAQNFNKLAISLVKDDLGVPMIIEVPYPERTVFAQIWKVLVGRVSLFLLDTNIAQNSDYDRSISDQLYGGDNEHRLKQEIMLGIGGIMALNKLGIKKDVYHCNEGHAAFIGIQRLIDYIQNDNLSIGEALEVVRSSALYTVHTPVPAGHDYFDENIFSKYMEYYANKLGITIGELLDMGRENPNSHDKFSMSVFACNTCQCVNGVSYLHGQVSKKMFSSIWKGYLPEENHVGYVTNGVHMPTWTTSMWKELYAKYLPKEFCKDQSNVKFWSKIYDVPDHEIWTTKMELKKKLIDHIKILFEDSWLKSQQDPSKIVGALGKINKDALIIGFARRFATYKRAHLLFTDLDRLEKIVNNPDRPVQFLFTGKAHPSDGAGQGLIKRIIEVSRMPQFLGKVIFLANYDIRLAKRIVSGVDIWLNTPTRLQEASGTSGEKAQMNGVLNFSVKDGWWYEGYVEGAGWALSEKQIYDNPQYQDNLDAATIYSMLENDIVPLFFRRDENSIPEEWIKCIKKSIAEITPHYTTKRMIDDYIERFYKVLYERNNMLANNNFAKAKQIAAWKKSVVDVWSHIEVPSLKIKVNPNPTIGDTFEANAIVDTKGLNGNSIGLEFVIAEIDSKGALLFENTIEFDLVKKEGSLLYLNMNFDVKQGGAYKYAFRLFPKNSELPHRMDFCYVKWIKPTS